MSYRNRERVRRVLAHAEADRVPYHAIHPPQVRDLVEGLGLDQDHRAFCLEGDFATVMNEPEVEASRFRPYFESLPEDVAFSCWGIGQQAQRTTEGWHAGHRMFHPLANITSIDELRDFPFPEIAGSRADQELEQKVRALKEQGYTVLGQMSQTILETAYNLRGIPQLMMDFHERPRFVECLFEALAERRLHQARRFAEAGVDILRVGDDIAAQTGLIISPALYRERIKPLHAAVIREARAVLPDLPVKYHSDGQLTDLLPDLMDIGVTIINPVQPECMDLRETKKRFGRDLTLWGCMPVQSIFQHGAREDVRRHLKFLMEEIAVEGGLVVNFINFLITERSLENLGAFFQAFYEMGRYDSRSRHFSEHF